MVDKCEKFVWKLTVQSESVLYWKKVRRAEGVKRRGRTGWGWGDRREDKFPDTVEMKVE